VISPAGSSSTVRWSYNVGASELPEVERYTEAHGQAMWETTVAFRPSSTTPEPKAQTLAIIVLAAPTLIAAIGTQCPPLALLGDVETGGP